jgi:hypothetical protein
MWCAGARAALGPPARNFVFLTNARFVREPNFYLVQADAFLLRDFVQAGRETFLKSSIAPSA